SITLNHYPMRKIVMKLLYQKSFPKALSDRQLEKTNRLSGKQPNGSMANEVLAPAHTPTKTATTTSPAKCPAPIPYTTNEQTCARASLSCDRKISLWFRKINSQFER